MVCTCRTSAAQTQFEYAKILSHERLIKLLAGLAHDFERTYAVLRRATEYTMHMTTAIFVYGYFVQMREKNRRSRGINYNNEVAFEMRPAPGFFDTAAEQATTREVGREFRPTTVEEIEGKRPRVRSVRSGMLAPCRGQKQCLLS